MKFISKFALLVVILTGLYLLISGNLFTLNLFLVVQALAVVVMIWARRSFQSGQFSIHAEPQSSQMFSSTQMFSSGPYHFIRHPMYASALVIIWAGILGHLSPLNLVIGFIVMTVVFIRVTVEEQYLRTYYPDYIAYAHKTKRLIPFLI
jgi:protein-S-isoprenylcysteine O-methyltransferase Ste14